MEDSNRENVTVTQSGHFNISAAEFAELVGYRVLVPQLLIQIDALRDSIQVPTRFNGQDSVTIPEEQRTAGEPSNDRGSISQKSYPTGQTTDYNHRLS